MSEAALNSWGPVAGASVYSESTQAFTGLEGAWTPLRALEEPPLNLKGTRLGRMVARTTSFRILKAESRNGGYNR